MDLSLFSTDELVALARLDVEERKMDAALAKIKTALQKEPTHADVVALGARTYAQLKLYARAKELYHTYLEQQPGAITEQFQLGMVTLESGEPVNALQIWQDVLEAVPTHPPALFYSGLASLELGRKEEAQRYLDILIKSAPVDNLYFGRAKEGMQQLNDAQAPQTKALDEVYQ
jgi:tetratricopeptide (TPR) repeat protein